MFRSFLSTVQVMKVASGEFGIRPGENDLQNLTPDRLLVCYETSKSETRWQQDKGPGCRTGAPGTTTLSSPLCKISEAPSPCPSPHPMGRGWPSGRVRGIRAAQDS